MRDILIKIIASKRRRSRHVILFFLRVCYISEELSILCLFYMPHVVVEFFVKSYLLFIFHSVRSDYENRIFGGKEVNIM